MKWVPRVGHRLAFGYDKSFADSWFTNYVAYNAFSGSYALQVASRIEAQVEGTWRMERYVGATQRTDSVLKGLFSLDYVSADWLRAGGYVSWRQRDPLGDSDPTVAYRDLMAGLRVSASY